MSETLFPKGAVPHAQRDVPQPVEPEAFVHLLRACQLTGSPWGLNAGMTARNRAILWLPARTPDSRFPRCAVYVSRMWTALAEP